MILPPPPNWNMNVSPEDVFQWQGALLCLACVPFHKQLTNMPPYRDLLSLHAPLRQLLTQFLNPSSSS